jgi:hypothetical protein
MRQYGNFSRRLSHPLVKAISKGHTGPIHLQPAAGQCPGASNHARRYLCADQRLQDWGASYSGTDSSDVRCSLIALCIDDCDVNDEGQVEAAIRQSYEHFGAPNGVFANAGIDLVDISLLLEDACNLL